MEICIVILGGIIFVLSLWVAFEGKKDNHGGGKMSEIAFTNIDVLKGMFRVAWHPKLIALLVWIKIRYDKASIILTCAYEERDYPSPHSTKPLRAFDMRSTTFKYPANIAKDINSEWVYDPGRPDKRVAIYHDVGRGLHLHLQVHDNTKWLMAK